MDAYIRKTAPDGTQYSELAPPTPETATVKRYDEPEGDHTGMYECEGGLWIYASDFLAMQSRAEAAEKERDEMYLAVDALQKQEAEMKASINEDAAELTAMESQLAAVNEALAWAQQKGAHFSCAVSGDCWATLYEGEGDDVSETIGSGPTILAAILALKAKTERK